MHEFETVADFIGEERPCTVEWDWAEDQVLVQGVKIILIIEHNWTPRGGFKLWREQVWVQVKDILSEEQISDFARQIKAAEVQRAAEDFHDSRLLDWEDRRRYAKAA